MLVSRARMSTLFALVKTHNCLIYILFPPQNRKPLCAPAFCFPSPPTTTIRVITQSASELHVANRKGSHESSWGSWTVTDRETARGVWDGQTGSLRKGYFLWGKSHWKSQGGVELSSSVLTQQELRLKSITSHFDANPTLWFLYVIDMKYYICLILIRFLWCHSWWCTRLQFCKIQWFLATHY